MMQVRPWQAALLGLAPTLAMVAVHLWLHPAGAHPTGFLQYDQPYYMANAREHFDNGFHLLYGLPFSDNPETPRIYFQPHLFLLGVLQHLTGLAPGWLYLGAGLLAGLGCLRVLATLFAEAVGLPAAAWRGAHWLAWLLLCWGGGLLALAGVGLGLATGTLSGETVLRFDPEGGWWLLNLGRNFVYATESYYHLLTFGIVLALWRRRWGVTVGLLALLSASHPFTGLKALLVVLVWSVGEWRLCRGADGRRPIPIWLTIAAGLLLAAHLGYYLLFLGQSPEQRALVAVWMKTPWTLSLGNAVLALALPGWFAYRRLRGGWGAALADPRVRLWLVMAAVTLALAEHDLLVTARQPIHFVRGYLYTSLFFLGLPALVTALQQLWPRKAVLVLLVSLFLSDNAIWYATQAARAAAGDEPFGWYLSDDQGAALADLNRLGDPRALLISDDVFTSYLAMAYTPVRAWMSHRFNTPDVDRHWETLNAFLNTGREPAEWRGRRLLILADKRWWETGPPRWWDAARMRRIATYSGSILVDRPAPEQVTCRGTPGRSCP